MSGKSKMSKTKNQKPQVRCQNRSWEVVLNFGKGEVPPAAEDVMKFYCQQKFGVYRGFIYPHSEDGATHYHIGLIFRDVPKTLMWNDVRDYFKFELAEKYETNKLKCKSRSFDKKLQQYYDYCNSEEQHPHQELGKPYHYKWEPAERTEDGLDLEKCNTKVYVQYFAEQGKTFKQIYKDAPLKRRADLACDMCKYQKQISNVKKIMEDEEKVHDISTFKPEVVEDILGKWNPEKESLVLKGPSNRGKTELAKSLLQHVAGEKPKMVSELNALGYREAKQPIVYDDMKFDKISRSKKIHLLDVENDRDIRILYGVHTIEAYTKRIFTTNEEDYEFLGDMDMAHKRRICWIDVTDFGMLYTPKMLIEPDEDSA